MSSRTTKPKAQTKRAVSPKSGAVTAPAVPPPALASVPVYPDGTVGLCLGLQVGADGEVGKITAITAHGVMFEDENDGTARAPARMRPEARRPGRHRQRGRRHKTMSGDKVWIRKRTLKDGTTTYHLRWIDPVVGKWRNVCVGSDEAQAKDEAVILHHELQNGTHQDAKGISWERFVDLHVASIAGDAHRRIAKRTLKEFGDLYQVQPRRIRRQMLKAFVVKPRRVPINPDLVDVLLRVQVQTQKDPGPFTSWPYDHVEGMMTKTVKKAGVEAVTLHSLRDTYVTRLIRENVELTAVARLAGHASIATTLKYYNAVHKAADLRAGVAKLQKRTTAAG